jgi:MoaA/NifB/PqqE/SkfB family radical SAM enzyme
LHEERGHIFVKEALKNGFIEFNSICYIGDTVKLRQQLSLSRSFMGIMHGSRAFGGPVQAGFSLTNRCNIRCIHCYYYSPYAEKPNLFELRKARQKSEELPDKEYLRGLQRLDVDSDLTRKLIDELTAMGTQKYIFSGSGEPFLHKNALEFMGRAKRAGSICTVYTNGTLLDRSIIDELLRMRFDELRITTLAGTRNMYLKTHSGVKDKTFDNLRDNLVYLAERKAEMGVKRPEVTLIFIAITQNCSGIFQFAEFAELVKAERVVFRPVDTAEDPRLKKFLVPTAEQAASVREQLVEVKAYLESRGVANNIEYFLKVFREKLDTTALYRVIPCYYGWLAAWIDVGGQVYPCCRCYEPRGNVYEKEFHEIWNGNAYRKFRKEGQMINKRKTPVSRCNCNSCTHYTANTRVYKAFHPLKGRSELLRGLSQCGFVDEEL